MVFKLTAINCRVLGKTRKNIDRHLRKVGQFLPNIEDDLVVLWLTIKKNIDKYHPVKTKPHPHKVYADLKPALAYFEGSIHFRLNKNRLYAHFKGQTIDECINLGFDRLLTELKRFKNLHFSAESEYPNRSSIRFTGM